MAGYPLDDPRLQEAIEEQAARTAAEWPVDEPMLARLQPLLAAPLPARVPALPVEAAETPRAA